MWNRRNVMSRSVVRYPVSALLVVGLLCVCVTHWYYACRVQANSIGWLASQGVLVDYEPISWWNLPRRLLVLIFGVEHAGFVHEIELTAMSKFVSPTIDADIFHEISNLHTTKRLIINHRGSVSFPPQLGLPNLECLTLRGIRIIGGLSKERQFPKLKVLSFQHCDLRDSDLNSFPECPCISYLEISASDVTGQFLETPSRWQTLRTLEITSSRLLVDEYMHRIADLQNLRVLSLHGSSVDNASVAWISKLAELEELDISYTKITGNSISGLSGLNRLRELVIGGPFGEFSDLTDPTIFPHLVVLRVTVEQLDSELICKLKTLKKLELLVIDFATISEDAHDLIAKFIDIEAMEPEDSLSEYFLKLSGNAKIQTFLDIF